MQAPVSPTPGSCGLSDHPCRKAIEGGGQLADILAGMPEIVEALGSVDAIRHHCDPANYLGLSGQMVDRALGVAAQMKHRRCDTRPADDIAEVGHRNFVGLHALSDPTKCALSRVLNGQPAHAVCCCSGARTS